MNNARRLDLKLVSFLCFIKGWEHLSHIMERGNVMLELEAKSEGDGIKMSRGDSRSNILFIQVVIWILALK